jgi:tetratricopeptide (TPR) repeat protein
VFAGNPYGYYEIDYLYTSAPHALDWLVKNKLTDTTHRYTVAVFMRSAAVYAASKQYSNIDFVGSSELMSTATACDYVMHSSAYKTYAMLRQTFPPKGTVYVERVDGDPVCAVVAQNPFDAEGIRLIREEHYAEGIALSERAYAAAPDNIELWTWLGLGYLRLGDLDRAIEFLQKYSMNVIVQPDVQLNALRLLAEDKMQQDKYVEAIEYLQLATRANLNVGDAEVQSFIDANLSVCYYYLQDCAHALPYLERSVAVFPELQGFLEDCKAR